ncbi:MAG TPA: HNH endonuclease [Hymenobacter sp.]
MGHRQPYAPQRLAGWLVVYERDQVRWRLAFYDAYCVLHNTLFQPGRGLAAYELTLALSPAAVDLNGVQSEIYSDLWWEKKGDVRFRALTKPAELLSGPGVRSWPAERPPTKAQEVLPSPALSALTGAPLVSKPPKIALDPQKKPLYAPTIAKWYKKGGAIELLENGNWKFTDWEHNSVVYERDEPNFDQYARQQVDIDGMTGDCTTDFTKADNGAPLGPKKRTNTWHHKQNMRTMQEVPRDLHERFTHYGARYLLKTTTKRVLRKK